MRILFLTWIFLSGGCLPAQDLIRFTGVVLDRDEFEGIYGTTILNQTRGKGAVTDSLGFFTIEALPGDTLLFSDVRYVSSTFVVPEVLDQSDYGIIQLLVSSAQVLDEVVVYSFPDEKTFKQAFMDLETTEPDTSAKVRRVKRDLMKTIRKAYESDKYYYEMWADRRIYELTGQIPPNHFLDPIRWTNFLRDFMAEERQEEE